MSLDDWHFRAFKTKITSAYSRCGRVIVRVDAPEGYGDRQEFKGSVRKIGLSSPKDLVGLPVIVTYKDKELVVFERDRC